MLFIQAYDSYLVTVEHTNLLRQLNMKTVAVQKIYFYLSKRGAALDQMNTNTIDKMKR